VKAYLAIAGTRPGSCSTRSIVTGETDAVRQRKDRRRPGIEDAPTDAIAAHLRGGLCGRRRTAIEWAIEPPM
jgi:hypothetical protein